MGVSADVLCLLTLCLGAPLQAIAYYQRDLEIAQRLEKKRDLAVSHSNLAAAYQVRHNTCADIMMTYADAWQAYGDYAESVQQLNKYIALMRELGQQMALAAAHENMAAICEYQGGYDKVLPASHPAPYPAPYPALTCMYVFRRWSTTTRRCCCSARAATPCVAMLRRARPAAWRTTLHVASRTCSSGYD